VEAVGGHRDAGPSAEVEGGSGAVAPRPDDARDRAADRRDELADTRDRAADCRDELADTRDRAADRRDELADTRDHAADEREGRLEELAWRLAGVSSAHEDRAEESLRRSRQTLLRSEATLARSRIALDALRKRREREQATIDRETSASSRRVDGPEDSGS
jgi:septal ring factor EnvC (AmiA/AmiB activator)